VQLTSTPESWGGDMAILHQAATTFRLERIRRW
jgi:hypothetical protein